MRAQLCPALCDCSPAGSSVQGIFQARLLEWVAISFSKGMFPSQGLNLCLFASPALTGRFFTTGTIWEAQMSKGNDNFTVGLDSMDSQLVRVTLNKVVVKTKNHSFIKSLEDIESYG